MNQPSLAKPCKWCGTEIWSSDPQSEMGLESKDGQAIEPVIIHYAERCREILLVKLELLDLAVKSVDLEEIEKQIELSYEADDEDLADEAAREAVSLVRPLVYRMILLKKGTLPSHDCSSSIGGCQISQFSSRICKLGTKGCLL